MAEDVVFLVAGKPPMRGRNDFAAGFKQATESSRIESSSNIQEHTSMVTGPTSGIIWWW
jgi:ketosteroid isomerase-like protein